MSSASRDLAERVFTHLRTTGEWPYYRILERELWPANPIQQLLLEDDGELLRVEHSQPPRVQLTLAGIALCEGGSEVLQWLWTLVRAIASEPPSCSEEEHRRVHARDVAPMLGLKEKELCILRQVLDVAPNGGLRAGGSRDPSSCDFSCQPGDKAYLFRKVDSLEDYEEAVQRADQLSSLEQKRGGLAWLKVRRAHPKSLLSADAYGAATWDFHPAVDRASSRLFRAGAYAEAVRASLQAYEAFVQRICGLAETGTSLMSRAFADNDPAISLNTRDDRHGRGEQQGFRFLTMGAVLAFRNQYSHGDPVLLSREEALEQLGFASYLFRRTEQVSGMEAIVRESLDTAED